jgi:hypothetical protein
MEIHDLNRVIDMFMKEMYDLDVYFTPDSGNAYRLNVLIFPSKFLRNSPDFSEKYFNVLTGLANNIERTIYKAFMYLGINSADIKIDDIRVEMASDSTDYLTKYSNEIVSHINDFLEFGLDDFDLKGRVSNVRIDRMEPGFYGVNNYEPEVNLRLRFDSNFKYDLGPFLNDGSFRGPLIEYLNEEMELDPQIDFWFE